MRDPAAIGIDIGGTTISVGLVGESDTIHDPFALPGWDGANPVRVLEERLGVRAYLEDGADAALLGQARGTRVPPAWTIAPFRPSPPPFGPSRG